MKLDKLYLINKFLARLSKREKLVFYVSVVFVILFLFDRLVFVPINSKFNSLNKEIKEKETSINTGMHILAQKDEIASMSQELSSYTSTLQSDEEEISALLKEIENLANQSSVYLIDLKPAGVKDSGSSKEYFINLNCEAQLEQLSKFMYDIESSSRLLLIDKFQISPKSKESSVAKCNMAISEIAIR
jgi:Tfp pilus assembly protein PilO